MRVVTYEYDSWVDPARAFARVYGAEPHAVWLDSGANAIDGFSFMGAGSRRVVLPQPDDTHIMVDGVARADDILDFIEHDLERWAAPPAGVPLGWMGWLGYEYRHRTVGTPVTHRAHAPAAAFMFVDRGIMFDHATQSVRMVALADSWTDELRAWRDGVVGMLRALTLGGDACAEGDVLDASVDHHASASRDEVQWQFSDDEYLQRIRACQDAIAAGEAYQLCLTMEARLTSNADPLEVFVRLRALSPAPHSALVRFGGHVVLSASPERFLRASADGVLESKPIKGTRPRRADPQADAAVAVELQQNVKERAENVMIVDLMRNDLGRVARLGSVHVPILLRVESYAQVHQLVSTVRAALAPEHTVMDAVRSCFPAGSMTGAPKRRATEIIDQVEGRARGIYSGAVGYFAADGSADLAMVIRTIVLGPDGARLGAGGGITALSIPDEELAEVKLKASALIAAVTGAPAPQRS